MVNISDLEKYFDEYKFNVDEKHVNSEIQKILDEDFDANNNPDVWRKCFSLIDLTSLNSTDTEEKIKNMMLKVNDFGNHYNIDNVAAVCVYPSLVPVTRKNLKGNTKIAAVSACFPASQSFIEVKIAEVALTQSSGADEIDIVISIGKMLEGKYMELYDEIKEIKSACKGSKLKVIIESGALSFEQIKKASILSIMAGANFIKTSTGKMEPAATLQAAWIMAQTIKEYHQKTGVKIGFKPAGGIASTEDAVKFYSIIHRVLGEEWITPNLFRFGASRLANNLLSSIYNKEIKYY